MKYIIDCLLLIVPDYKKYIDNDMLLDIGSKHIRKQTLDDLLKYCYIYRKRDDICARGM